MKVLVLGMGRTGTTCESTGAQAVLEATEANAEVCSILNSDQNRTKAARL